MSPDAPRILVVRLSSMGDIILITPALEAIKDHFPRAHLDVLVKARYADLLQGHPLVDGLFVLRPRQGLFSLAKQLREQHYDILIDLHASLRSRMLSALLPGVKRKRYHKRSLARRLMLLTRFRPDPAVHTVDLYLRILKPLGIRANREPPTLYVQEADQDFGQQYLKEHRLANFSTLVGLHPGARWPGKRWPAERFAGVGRELEKRGQTGILIFGGPGEEQLADQVARQISPSSVAAIDLSLRQLMALITRCDLFITNDSGPMHLATALGVPVVAIFGPTHPALGFWPLGERDVVLTANLKCSPCSLHGKRECPRNWHCLDEIKVKDVLEAARNILDGEGAASPSEEPSDSSSEASMSHVAVFLDRDGTINREVHYLREPEQLELLPGAGESIRKLNDLGLKVLVVTNQSGVARGYLTEELLHRIHELLKEMLAEQGARLDGIYFCPEMPESGSRCRKPEIGMMEQAAREHDIDLKRSYMVGDMAKDIEMGQRAGAKTILVLTGYGQGDRDKVQPDFMAQDLADAVRWIEQDVKETGSRWPGSSRA